MNFIDELEDRLRFWDEAVYNNDYVMIKVLENPHLGNQIKARGITWKYRENCYIFCRKDLPWEGKQLTLLFKEKRVC